MKVRLDETMSMYEQSQRDLRNRQQDLQRLNAELEKTRELKDALARENKKLGGTSFIQILLSQLGGINDSSYVLSCFLDDLNDAKNQLGDMNRRLHELELELRRLENEREELAAAYKEAEAVSRIIHLMLNDFQLKYLFIKWYDKHFQGRKIEEQRSQRLSAELSQLRHETERRIAEKDEEIEIIR